MAIRSIFPVLSILIFNISNLLSQNVFYKLASFYIPGNTPYIETSMTIPGNSLNQIPVIGGFQSAVSVGFMVLNSSGKIAAANKYNVIGPVYQDTAKIPAFVDHQRYTLPNGTYTIEMTVEDKYAINTKPYTIIQRFEINYDRAQLHSSTIQFIESFQKAEKPGSLTKSGYDMVPYNISWYPEAVNKLNFYYEAYNADTVLGINEPFIFNYYIENYDNLTPVIGYASFQKQKAAKVNPILGQFDITNLPSGNYNIVVELKDKTNQLKLKEKYFFQRKNTEKDIANKSTNYVPNALEKYFNMTKSPDTLKIFVECLWPISDMKERDRQINVALKKDTTIMRNYLVNYWTNMASDTANPMKLWMDYLRSVNEAEALFKCGKQKGYYSDRGRVYLQYGKPNQRTVQVAEPNTYPYEIWEYYRITDKTNGQFFTDRKFIFVNKNIADNCYRLEHSDMKGEVYNDRWRYEVMKHQTDGIGNPDNTSPSNMGNNQVNDLFNSPR